QVEGFIEKRDGTAVPFDAKTFVPSDAKTVAATKEQIDAAVSFWSETRGKEFLGVAKALQEKLRDSEKKKAQDEKRSPPVGPNHSMKPTAPWRNKFSVFATTPCRGLSPSR